MSQTATSALALLLLVSGPAIAGSQEISVPKAGPAQPDPQEAQMDSDASDLAARRILVRFEDRVATEAAETIHKRLGATVVDRMLGGSLYLVELPYPGIRDQVIEAYAATDGVAYAEPDQAVSIPQPAPRSETIDLPKVE